MHPIGGFPKGSDEDLHPLLSGLRSDGHGRTVLGFPDEQHVIKQRMTDSRYET